MSAQPSTAQPTTVVVPPAILSSVLAAAKQAHPERAARLDRAARIVAAGGVQPGLTAGWWVRSETDPSKEYWVYRTVQAHAGACQCRDALERGNPCKHGLAVELSLACVREEVEREGAAPAAPIPFPTERYPEDARFTLTPKGYAALGQPVPPDDDEPPPAMGAAVPVLCRVCSHDGLEHTTYYGAVHCGACQAVCSTRPPHGCYGCGDVGFVTTDTQHGGAIDVAPCPECYPETVEPRQYGDGVSWGECPRCGAVASLASGGCRECYS